MSSLNLPIASHGTCVDGLIEDFRRELRNLAYGDVGLIFTVQDGMVVKWRQIKEVTTKPMKTTGERA